MENRIWNIILIIPYFPNTSTCKINIDSLKKIITCSGRIIVEKFLLLTNCRYNAFDRYLQEI